MAQVVERTGSDVPSVVASVYLLLFPIPIVCFLGTVLTDIAYSKSAFLMWLHFSEWLLAAGLGFGALAALALLLELLANNAAGIGRFGWTHLALFVATLIVELVNALVHSVDGWNAVVPDGMTLSVMGAILSLAAVTTLFRAPVARVTQLESPL